MDRSRGALLWLETALAAVALTGVVAGLVLVILTTPAYTDWLVRRVVVPDDIGLSAEAAWESADAVRAFVASRDTAVLPAAVEGRVAFDASAVSHLVDVREVISTATTVSGVLAALLAVWVVIGAAGSRWIALGRGLEAGGGLSIALVILVAVAGLLDFSGLFTEFHGVFFEPGTWTFASTDLLVQLFPIPFWTWSAVAFGALMVVGGLILVAGGWWLVRRGAAENREERAAEASTGAAE